MAVDDRGPELLIITWVFTALAIILVALKLFTRQRFLQGLGWDDFFIFLSLILIVIGTSLFTYAVYPLGMGKHAAELGRQRASEVVRIILIAGPFGVMAYSFPNISVAILLQRLLAPNKLRTSLLYLLVCLQVVISAVSCILLLAQCRPTESLWNPTIQATCFPPKTVSKFSFLVGWPLALTAFTDVVLGIVPIAAFWGLRLPTRSKVGLCILMGCTLFAAVCSAVKTSKLSELDDFSDFTYTSVQLIIWVIVEANVMIIAACMPNLRPFFHNTFKKDKGTITEGRGFFRSLFSSSSSSKKSLVGSKRASAPLADNQPQMSAPKKATSTDSERKIWRTTDIRQDTEPAETHGFTV
ncbi:putative Integral membrane protein [Seiridium unicorne]|uniref:Integral membrane protein n=1 Tax=Seiridium unicorne TaxID=138068 RepID=A0ABR2VBU1_9PEZI